MHHNVHVTYCCVGRGQTRTITKTVPNESFFNFFDPPARKTTCDS